MAYLCLDLGSTRLKVAVIAADGRLRAQRSARLDDYRDGQRSWQSADQWWRLALHLAADIDYGPAPIEALSLSGRGGAAVFVDAAQVVLADPWQDPRHAGEQQALRSTRRDERHVSNYASALLAKAVWLRTHQPRLWQRVHHVLYAKDFLLLRLTGRAITDPSSGPDAPAWPADVLQALDVSPARLPQIALPWSIAGPLTAGAARALGLRSGVPVVVGGHDGICANIGCGAASVGSWALTLGTHAVVRTITATHPAGARRFYGLPPERHVIGGNGLFGGRAADWFADLLFGRADADREAHFQQLEQLAVAAGRGARGVDFQPFLGGQVAPRQRPQARAAFAGLQLDSHRGDLYRSVLEGTGFALRAIVDQLSGWCGAPPHMRLTGGGARSTLWCQLLADMLDTPLEYPGDAAENRGAAICAAVALGHFGDIDSAAAALVPPGRRYVPDSEGVSTYARLYEGWQRRSAAD